MPEEIFGRKSYSISEYIDMPNVPQPYIVDGMIYEHGKTVFVGKPKFGKSHLAVKTGLSVALGQPILGLSVKQCPVLLLEFDRRYLIALIHEISKGKKTEMMHIIPAQGVALNELEGYRLLLASVNKYCPKDGSPLLVIIDHKSACFAGKENDDAPNKEWIANLDKIANVWPVSYLVISQAPKSWKGDLVDLPIGSRVLTAWADTIVAVWKPNRESRRLEMSTNYREIDPITYTKDFRVIADDAVDETKLEAAMTIIQEQWDEFVYPDITKKVQEVVEKSGCSYTTAWAAYREVKKLMKATGSEKAPEPEADSDDEKTS